MSLNPLAQEFVPSFLPQLANVQDVAGPSKNRQPREVHGVKFKDRNIRPQHRRSSSKGQRHPDAAIPHPTSTPKDLEQQREDKGDEIRKDVPVKSYASILLAKSSPQPQTDEQNKSNQLSVAADFAITSSRFSKPVSEQRPPSTLFACKPAVAAVEAHKQRWIDVSHELTVATATQQQSQQPVSVLQGGAQRKKTQPQHSSSDMWHHVLRNGLETQQISDDADD
ncbi:hypothetical protein EON64_01105, partial [archaeon]